MYITFLCPSIFFSVLVFLPSLASSSYLPPFPLLFSSPPQPSSYSPPLYSSLVFKCGTTLLYINLLFIQIHISLPAILPYYRHWDNLAINILSLHTLHS